MSGPSEKQHYFFELVVTKKNKSMLKKLIWNSFLLKLVNLPNRSIWSGGGPHTAQEKSMHSQCSGRIITSYDFEDKGDNVVSVSVSIRWSYKLYSTRNNHITSNPVMLHLREIKWNNWYRQQRHRICVLPSYRSATSQNHLESQNLPCFLIRLQNRLP